MLPLIGIGYGVTLVISVVFGGLTWIGLRMTRRESGRAYVLAGAVGGALVSVRFGLDGARLSASLLAAVALCVLAGALVAFCFWLIAREPGTAAPSPAA